MNFETKSRLIKENREIRKYLDLVEEEIKTGTQVQEIDLFNSQNIYDHSCKCGGEFEYSIFREHLEKPLICSKCGKEKSFKQIKFLETKKSLKEDIIENIQNSITTKIDRDLSDISELRQILLKLYRLHEDGLKTTTEPTEEQKEKAKKIFNSVRITANKLKHAKILTISQIDTEYIQTGELDYSIKQSPRTKTIEDIEFTNIGYKIADILERQIQEKFILKIVQLEIPDQKERDNRAKSIQSLIAENQTIYHFEDTNKVKNSIDEKRRIQENQKKNAEQLEEHMQLLQNDPYYAVNHAKAHWSLLEDDENKNPNEYDILRFMKSEKDRFYLPKIKVKHYDYDSNAGMISREDLLKSLLAIAPEVSPAYKMEQIRKQKQKEESEKLKNNHDEFVANILKNAGLEEKVIPCQ